MHIVGECYSIYSYVYSICIANHIYRCERFFGARGIFPLIIVHLYIDMCL